MELTVTERERVTERVIVALLLGDLVRLSVTLDDRVNGRVVGIPDRLTVTERVRVANIDGATVVRGEGVLVTERERVLDTVGLTDRVNGRVVGIADLLTVREPVRVANIDAGIVLRGEGLTETERERVANPDAGTV